MSLTLGKWDADVLHDIYFWDTLVEAAQRSDRGKALQLPYHPVGKTMQDEPVSYLTD